MPISARPWRLVPPLLVLSAFLNEAADARSVGDCENLDDLIDQSDLIVVASIPHQDIGLTNGWMTYDIRIEEILQGAVATEALTVALVDAPGPHDLANVPEPGRMLLFLRKTEGRFVGVDCGYDQIGIEPDIAIPPPEPSVRDRVLRLLAASLACHQKRIDAEYKRPERFSSPGAWLRPIDEVIADLDASRTQLDADPCNAHWFRIGLD